jgi:peptide/nickel transport system substrate-binding protein
MSKKLWAALGIAAALALPGAASAQKSADTLRIVWRDAIPNVDPYYNQLRVGLVVATMAFDTLLYRDPKSFELKPLLATAWSWVDPTTLDLELRQGVRFHNGAAFDADDVVYTFNLVSSPDAKVLTPSNVNWIASAEKLDQYKVRLHLKKPFPAALEYLALVTPIYPHEYRAKVGPEGMGKAPVGSGPYKIVKVDGVAEIDFVRNEDYFAESPKGRPKIGKLVIRAVPDEATEMVELLAGNADWIWNFNADQFDRINSVPDLTATRAESMRIGFLGLDAAGRTGAGNPLTNEKVRQAVFYAIDRESIAKNLVQGGSRVPPGPCFPTQFGCDASAAPHYAYDPAKAKQLLAEAGFPNGFKTEIVGFRSPQWTAAIQGYLRAVGIDAGVTMLQVAAVVDKNHRGELQMYHGDWGSFGINDTSASMGNFFEGSADDQARDPEVKALLEVADTSIDPALRKENYRKAIEIVMAKAYWLPLHTFVTTYAYRKELAFTPYPDEIPRFYLDSWN